MVPFLATNTYFRINRYLNTNHELIWFDDERLSKVIPTTFATCIFAKVLGNILYVNLGPNLCMTETLPPLFVMVYLALPGWTMLIIATIMDIISFFASLSNNFDTQVPMRSSVIHWSVAVVMFIAGIVHRRFDNDPVQKVVVAAIFNVIVTSTALPLVIRFGLPVNSINVAPTISREEQRSRNQQREVEHAVQKRQETREGWLKIS